MAKRRGKKRAARASGLAALPVSQKINLVMKNFIAFLVLFIIFFILYKITSAIFWNDLFFLLALVFGFVGLAFLIAWLVMVFAKAGRK